MSSSLLSSIELAPRDPILGVTETFNADTNPRKVNLGVGVYYDDEGKVPVLECVRRAEQKLAADARCPATTCRSTACRPTTGRSRSWCSARTATACASGRVVTVQALGGTGGLKVGADLLRRINPAAAIWISDPSWENHQAMFDYAGFKVQAYPYYDPGDAQREFRRHAGHASRSCPRATSSCCTSAATTRPAWIFRPEQWERDHRGGQSPRPRALPRSRLPGFRRRPRCRRGAAAPLRRGLPCGVRFDARSRNRCRSTASGSARCTSSRRIADEAGARAVPVEARHPHQLLQPADARRAGGRHGADHARAARAVGPGARGRCATASS